MLRWKAGGNQGNTFTDVEQFLREANESRLPDTVFMAICDGEFYEGKGPSGLTRLQELKDIANRRNVFAISIDELDDFLVKICTKK